MLSSALRRVFDDDGAKFKFPPEVAAINPRFTRADLVDAGSGKGELQVEAEAVIRAADMPRIMSLIDR
jgi:phytoene dehydrogenase-like protein